MRALALHLVKICYSAVLMLSHRANGTVFKALLRRAIWPDVLMLFRCCSVVHHDMHSKCASHAHLHCFDTVTVCVQWVTTGC
jgi:hypothetical protein